MNAEDAQKLELDYQKLKLDYQKMMDEDYRTYRQSGLGLSAIVIFLSGALLTFILKHQPDTSSGSFPSPLFYVNGLFLVLAIVAAISIQWFHYEGYKCYARRHFPDPPTPEEKKRLMDQANGKWFPRGDHSVYVSLGFLLIGFILSIAYWRLGMANGYRFLQAFLTCLLLLGIWIVAFGLRVEGEQATENRESSPPLLKVRIRPSWWGWTGLGLITLVGLLQIYIVASY